MMIKHQVSSPSAGYVSKIDSTFIKMCSKFRSKKTVWIAHFSYLLEQGRYDEAQKVVQKALLSLQSYKHVETLTKYAILAFTHGQVNTARTVFDGLLTKHPKRLDLFFVYIDQEIKSGNIVVARSMFQRVASRGNKSILGGKTAATNDEILSALKYNDKQMKRLFKKWYAFEEAHGTDISQENVKDAARAYVESSMQ
jgi:rRNA biogenesis protein RRP5